MISDLRFLFKEKLDKFWCLFFESFLFSIDFYDKEEHDLKLKTIEIKKKLIDMLIQNKLSAVEIKNIKKEISSSLSLLTKSPENKICN